MVPGHLVAVVLDEIRRLLDVAHAFEPVLARLVPHQRRELPAMIADRVGDLLQQRRRDRTSSARSMPERRPWPLRSPPRPARGWRSETGPSRILRVDRTSVVEFTRRPNLATADDQRITLAEGRFHLLDRPIELAVQILHAIAAHRGVGDLRLRSVRISCHNL